MAGGHYFWLGASADADRAATPSEPSPAVSGIAGIPSAVFADVCEDIDALIKTACIKHRHAGFFAKRRAREELLNRTAYGVRNLLRAASLIHARCERLERP